MRVLFVASEVAPFAKTGGLADVVGSLPLALERLGIKVDIAMPYYKVIAENRSLKLSYLNEDFLYTKIGKDIGVYFVKHDSYYNRDGLYGDVRGDYPDNLERFSFLCKKAIKLIEAIKEEVKLIHCHDWQTALIPVYLKTVFKQRLTDIKTIFTIHNLGYQGLFSKEEFNKLGLPQSIFDIQGLEFYGKINFLKGGIVFSDIITTVSPTYASQIQTKEFGCGLEDLLSQRKKSLFGILNGLDYSIWNPQTDPYIYERYNVNSLEKKFINKKKLKQHLKLKENSLPLFGMVSRLAEQKGLDILVSLLENMKNLALQMIILGKGDLKYERLVEEFSNKFENLYVALKFDEVLAHRIYAGADFFLMPSKYEPCGLGQMISLTYATIPIVYKTGGLADTIQDMDISKYKGNGIAFSIYSKEAFLEAIKKALILYRQKEKLNFFRKKAMEYRFTWQDSAQKYIELYKRLLK